MIVIQHKHNIFFLLLLYITYLPVNSSSTNSLKTNAKKQFKPTADKTQPKDNKTNLFNIYQPVCSSLTCPMPYAYCSTPQNCHCSKGYANFKQDGQNNRSPCQYEQKKQLTAFLLELIFPFGVGHLYALRNVVGILKMLFILATPFIVCCFVFCGIMTMDSLFSQKVFSTLSAIIGIIYTIGTLVWIFVDLLYFGLNRYNDGNGVPLLTW